MVTKSWFRELTKRLRAWFGAGRSARSTPSSPLRTARANATVTVHHGTELVRAHYRLHREAPVRAVGGEPIALVAVEEQGHERAVFHHGTCPVNHRSARAAAACRRGESPVPKTVSAKR